MVTRWRTIMLHRNLPSPKLKIGLLKTKFHNPTIHGSFRGDDATFCTPSKRPNLNLQAVQIATPWGSKPAKIMSVLTVLPGWCSICWICTVICVCFYVFFRWCCNPIIDCDISRSPGWPRTIFVSMLGCQWSQLHKENLTLHAWRTTFPVGWSCPGRPVELNDQWSEVDVCSNKTNTGMNVESVSHSYKWS